MFCTKCGKEIPDVEGALYCPQCGVAQMTAPAKPVKKTSTAVILILVLVLGGIPVLGIIAAIAIPQFAAYKSKGSNSYALAEVKNAKAACEAYFVDHKRYPDDLTKAGYNVPPRISARYERGEDRKDYLIVVSHKDGNRQYATNSEQPTIYQRMKSETDDAYKPL